MRLSSASEEVLSFQIAASPELSSTEILDIGVETFPKVEARSFPRRASSLFLLQLCLSGQQVEAFDYISLSFCLLTSYSGRSWLHL